MMTDQPVEAAAQALWGALSPVPWYCLDFDSRLKVGQAVELIVAAAVSEIEKGREG
jgi:hypothetical protein